MELPPKEAGHRPFAEAEQRTHHLHTPSLPKQVALCGHGPRQRLLRLPGVVRIVHLCHQLEQSHRHVSLSLIPNKISRSCRTHPGSIRQLALCPVDQSKLLMVYDKGPICIWNLQTKESERFAADQPPIKCASWQYDGKQFICGHADGSLTVCDFSPFAELISPRGFVLMR